MAYAHTHKANPHWLPARQGQALDFVPGDDGMPIFGTTFRQLKDPLAFTRHMVRSTVRTALVAALSA
jgi:hypothetical protein